VNDTPILSAVRHSILQGFTAPIRENQIECVGNAYGARNDQTRASVGQIAHPAFRTGAKTATGNASTQEHPPSLFHASFRRDHE
jgi:hypothetical protein